MKNVSHSGKINNEAFTIQNALGEAYSDEVDMDLHYMSEERILSSSDKQLKQYKSFKQ